MTPADLTLPTPGANPLAVLPPRRGTGARVEPWISGVTAVEGIKILRPHNIGAYAKVGQNMDTRRAELQCVIVVCHLVSSSQHRRVPMHYVPVH